MPIKRITVQTNTRAGKPHLWGEVWRELCRSYLSLCLSGRLARSDAWRGDHVRRSRLLPGLSNLLLCNKPSRFSKPGRFRLSGNYPSPLTRARSNRKSKIVNRKSNNRKSKIVNPKSNNRKSKIVNRKSNNLLILRLCIFQRFFYFVDEPLGLEDGYVGAIAEDAAGEFGVQL